MIQKTPLWALLLCLLGMSLGAVAQETKTVQATGMATVSGDNTMAARDAAIRDAMRKAVENGLGTLIESQTLVENFALVNDRIYSQAQGFVSSYDVLSESEERGTYIVAISAVVQMANLENDLRGIGLMQDLAGKPKIMVMIDEFWWEPGVPKDRQLPVSDPASAASLEEDFLDRGFYNMVDALMVQQLRSTELLLMEDLMEDAGAMGDLAKKAAADYGAEVLVLGTCKVEPNSSAGGKYEATGVLDVRVVDAATGALLARKTARQAGAGTSPEGARSASGSRAAHSISSELIGQILNYWQNKSNNGQDYIVKLYNVESYARQGLRFLKALKEIPGVSQAKRRQWDEDLKRMEIAMTWKGGDPGSLGDEILLQVMDMPGFESIDMRRASGNNLDFYLQ